MTTQYEKYNQLIADLIEYEHSENVADRDESLETKFKHRMAEFTTLKRKELIDFMTYEEVRKQMKIPRKPRARCPKVGGGKKKKKLTIKCCCMETPRGKETGLFADNLVKWPTYPKHRVKYIQNKTDFEQCYKTGKFQFNGQSFCRTHYERYCLPADSITPEDEEVSLEFQIGKNIHGHCLPAGKYHGEDGSLPICKKTGRWGWFIQAPPIDDESGWKTEDKEVDEYLDRYLYNLEHNKSQLPHTCFSACKFGNWTCAKVRKSLESYLMWRAKQTDKTRMYHHIKQHFKKTRKVKKVLGNCKVKEVVEVVKYQEEPEQKEEEPVPEPEQEEPVPEQEPVKDPLAPETSEDEDEDENVIDHPPEEEQDEEKKRLKEENDKKQLAKIEKMRLKLTKKKKKKNKTK